MREKPVWWGFLRVDDGGWSSGFRSVDLLLKHLARKSRSVASRARYCYNLYRICVRGGVNPDELILKARENPEDVAFLVQGFADEHQARGSTRYANNLIHLTRSFFKVNKVDLDLHGYFQPTRSRKKPEYVPSLAEALKMADVAGSLRDRLIILFLIYTGLRNSTLRALVYNESYPDPLLQEHTIKKELERGEECLIIIVHEVMKKHVPNACKNRIFYYTFIPPKVTELLRLYLQERKEKYGTILDCEPIFITENRRIPLSERRKTPISSRELQEIVKKAAKRAEIKNWKYVYPHCLRKTYESFLRNQPDDVRLDVKEREFLFGHTLPGSQDAYFDKTKIEEIRTKYAKMVFEPIVGVKKEERVICEDELQTFLQQGWHFEAILSSGKVVVSRRTTVKPEETKAISSSQVSSNVTAQKADLQPPIQERLPPGICSAPPQTITQKDDNKDNLSNKQDSCLGLEKWINSNKNENYQRRSQSVPNFPNGMSAKEIKNATQDPTARTKQKSLLSFIV